MNEHSSDPTILKVVVALMLLMIVPYLNMGQERSWADDTEILCIRRAASGLNILDWSLFCVGHYSM
jgi:hypothetical protein